MRKFINLILGLMVAGALHAQTIQISGQVADTAEHKQLSNAVVAVLSADSMLIAFTRTDASGKFRLSVARKGPKLLLVTYPKFADYSDELTSDSGSLDLGKIAMIRKSALLQEVIVSQKIGAIRMKGDTLEFRADSFAVRQGANVEELLKKLPGLQVNKKGRSRLRAKKCKKYWWTVRNFLAMIRPL